MKDDQLDLPGNFCRMQHGPWRVRDVRSGTASDEASQFRSLFRRFDGDELNDWNESKQRKMGKLGLVTNIYEDDTVTMVFEDLERWDFPLEALEPSAPEFVKGFRPHIPHGLDNHIPAPMHAHRVHIYHWSPWISLWSCGLPNPWTP